MPDEWDKTHVGAFGCAGCDNRWTGLATAHCTICHRSFTTVSNFDKHTIIDYRKTKGYATCVDPASLGMVDAGRAYECWRQPGDGKDWWSK